jgi:hypothetical protein
LGVPPVYQDNPRLLYEKNFHRFVAMYAWLWMKDADDDASGMTAVEEETRAPSAQVKPEFADSSEPAPRRR